MRETNIQLTGVNIMLHMNIRYRYNATIRYSMTSNISLENIDIECPIMEHSCYSTYYLVNCNFSNDSKSMLDTTFNKLASQIVMDTQIPNSNDISRLQDILYNAFIRALYSLSIQCGTYDTGIDTTDCKGSYRDALEDYIASIAVTKCNFATMKIRYEADDT